MSGQVQVWLKRWKGKGMGNGPFPKVLNSPCIMMIFGITQNSVELYSTVLWCHLTRPSPCIVKGG